MINTTNINSSPQLYPHLYNGNYTPFQMTLPLNTEILISKNDPVFSFNEVMEGVNLGKFIVRNHKGRQEYNPFMMIKVVLFGEMLGGKSLRELEELCRNDIRFMFLAQNETPSHMAFSRFLNNNLKGNIKDVFYEINSKLIKLSNIDTSKIYIDGTKFEANANKFTFVWKKVAIKTRDKTFERITLLINKLNKDYSLSYETSSEYSLDYVDSVINSLILLLNSLSIDLVYGKGKRKSLLQRDLDLMVNYLFSLYSATTRIDICGEDRNSYSKSDYDATMMHMKEDYYSKTGIFKAGYNVQIGVSDEYIMELYISNARSDMATLIPFLEKYKLNYNVLPDKIVADAGYGSYDNYMYLTLEHRELFIKYNTYSIEKTAKYKRRTYNKNNWQRDEDNNFICPQGHTLEYIEDRSHNKGKYYRVNQIYQTDKCQSCPVKSECTKSENGRTVTSNFVLDEFQSKVKKNLDSQEGIELRVQRSIQSEGAFGIIKHNNGKTRFRRRGIDNVSLEMYIAVIGFNLMKYHQKKFRN